MCCTCIFDITCIFDVTELSLTSDGSQHGCVVLVSLTSLVYLTSLNSALLQMAASTGVLYSWINGNNCFKAESDCFCSLLSSFLLCWVVESSATSSSSSPPPPPPPPESSVSVCKVLLVRQMETPVSPMRVAVHRKSLGLQ